MKPKGYRGVFIATSIIFIWIVSTVTLLTSTLTVINPLSWIFILVQMHLFTGLFITAHDSMHHAVSSNAKLNHTIGKVCSALFMLNNYQNLYKKHHEHHRFVATEKDPDYHHSGNFFLWYFSFLKQYVSIWQIVFVAIIFNILLLVVEEQRLLIFWVIPSFLSTLQLFFFGTFLPHRNKHNSEDVYKSRSQFKSHLIAFFACYFFGYHYEHHRFPATPWWQLYKRKEEMDVG